MLDKTNLHKIAKIIGMEVKSWPGNCFAVSSKIVEHGIVNGEAKYGHWLGKVNPDCEIFDSTFPFQRHGWIVGEDGFIYDYTRWVFECKKPYVWIGENDTTYDNEGRYDIWELTTEKIINPLPKFNSKEATILLSEIIDLKTKDFLENILNLPLKISLRQIVWLANIPLHFLGKNANVIYKFLIDKGYSAFIPLDYKREAGFK
jgi:hypothetical protein